MNDQLTEIVCVIDRSGSMDATKGDAIGGFNSFLEEQQKEDGEARLTLVLFDHEYQVVNDGVDIQEVPALTDETYVPRGMTALLDAVGRTIDDVGVRLAATPEDERPGNVIFVILTDGAENASKEYAYARVSEMIEHQRSKYDWEFMFIGANIDAAKVAKSISIPTSHATNYVSDGVGTRGAMGQINYAVRSKRSKGIIASDWKDADESGTVSSDPTEGSTTPEA